MHASQAMTQDGWPAAEETGNRFKLIIFDEIHHLPAPSWREIALIRAAPYRLGLTATYPTRVDFIAAIQQARPTISGQFGVNLIKP